MADPVRLISAAVRDRARRGELADDGPTGAVREELRRYAEHAVASGAPQIADERQAERRIVAELSGFGPLQPLLDDPEIEEIWINGPTRTLQNHALTVAPGLRSCPDSHASRQPLRILARAGVNRPRPRRCFGSPRATAAREEVPPRRRAYGAVISIDPSAYRWWQGTDRASQRAGSTLSSMSDALSRGPGWVSSESRPYVGENPLAVSRHVTTQSRKLATAATSTTTHARYYTLHALIADESSTRNLSRHEQIMLIRRCEVVLAAVTIEHRDHHPKPLNPHGVMAIAAALERDGALDLAALAGNGPGSYTRQQWGFFWNYANAERALGLTRWTRDGLRRGSVSHPEAVRAGLEGVLDLARHDHIELEVLRHRSRFCLCQMSSAADGEALREVLLPSGTGSRSSSRLSAETIRLLLILLELNGGANQAMQEELGNFLLFDPIAQQDARLRTLDATPAWTGLFLREISVRAWHRLWSWLVKQIDGITTVEEVGGIFASQLPNQTLGAFVSELPQRTTNTEAPPQMLAAEELVDRDVSRSFPDRQLAKLLLGAQRSQELPPKVAVYFEHASIEGRSRLRPGWLRAQMDQWSERPLRDFAVHLTEQMIARASQITLAKARFEPSTGLYELPRGTSLRDGQVVKDADQPFIDTWFRWNAIARILAGIGLTELVDDRWRVTDRGRQR